MKRITIVALMVIGVGSLLPVGGCSTNPATGKREFILISTQQEISIGREAGPQFEDEFGGKVADERLQRYVRGVGMKVAAVSDRQGLPYEYTLLNSDIPNAFALPGGKIYITAGLLSRMGNERQLAAVLGHETGHVAARHNVKGLQRQVGASLLIELAKAIAGEKAEAAELAAKAVTGMVALRYSRDDEYQADMLGIRYATKAGYNPWGMVELLETLQRLSEQEGGSLTEMFQTHPLTGKRIEEAKEIIQENHPGASASQPDPNAAKFRQMRSLLTKG